MSEKVEMIEQAVKINELYIIINKNIYIFLEEYQSSNQGYIICRTPRPVKLAKNILALPWQDLKAVLKQ